MTIKKRLFISNILMIVIPAIVGMMSSMVFLAIARAYYGSEVLRTFRENRHEERIFEVDGFEMFAVLPVAGSVLIIIFANVFLIRFVFKKIEQPLKMLSDGDNQIRDGNLNHRIEYDTPDEFKSVCEDFNDMAARLLDMVNARQKDENNRRELIAGISHDLRTPLTSIKAYLEGIEKGVASTPELQQKYFNTIKEKTNDLEYIISQLFLFAKLDVGDFPFRLETVDIGNELCNFISNYENDLTILIKENTEDIFVSIDIVQFRNVIHNILNNSVKYSNSKQAETVITCRADGENAEIILTDNGQGVSDEMLDNLFEVFYRGDASRNNLTKGSGLGLAISKKIIERLNGTIKAENAHGGGLSIIITLPIIMQEGK